MKVLIVRVGALGDVLHALPSVSALHRAQPAWHIDWVVDPRWQPVLTDAAGNGPIVHHAHPAETRLWSAAPLSLATLRSIRTLRRTLRAQHYDHVIDMQGTLRSAVIGRLASAPTLTGYADPRESAAALLYSRKLARTTTHVVDQGATLLSAALNMPLAPIPADLPHEAWADTWAAAEAASGRLCMLAPGAGWGAKRWPAERFGALAIELKSCGYDVIVNAPRRDNPLAAGVVTASHGAARTVVCNVTGLIALLRRTSLLVGGDSGPTHLAATLGIPVVALFGPTDPARNGPWGAGPLRILRNAASVTTYKRNPGADPGLAQMDVPEVLTAALSLTV